MVRTMSEQSKDFTMNTERQKLIYVMRDFL